MDEQEYIKERLDDQIQWYGRKSRWNKKCYKRFRVIEILAAATIPFLSGYVTEVFIMKYIVGVLGVIIAIISGVIALYRFQENWTEFRTTAESLKHEKYLYLTGAEDYANENPFGLLVERVETLISKEHTRWSEYISSREKTSGATRTASDTG